MPFRFVFLPLLLLACVALVGCTSFSTVRSAEVHVGPSITLQAGATTPPGDAPAWFWSVYCTHQCNGPIAALDLNVAFGRSGSTPYTLGGGISGLLLPYLEGYAQLNGSGSNPYGLGARVGIPLQSWREYQVYGRYDARIGPAQRLLLNPAIFLHEGSAPSGANPGHLLAFVQGVGLLLEGERVSFVPAISIVLGRGERESVFKAEEGPFATAFAVASIDVTFHPRRSPAGGSP